MKIAIVSPWTISDTAVGGTERFVIDLAESLKNLGNEIDVYMLSGKSYSKNEINYININILGKDGYIEEKTLINMYGDFSTVESYIKLANSLEELINVEDYDLIQLNSQLFLKAFKNKKRIFTIHTNPFEFCQGFGEKAFETMIKLMKDERDNSTYFVTPSQFYKKNYEKLTGLYIDFIPHAINVSRIKKDINTDEVYNKYKINKKFKHILLPSRLEPVQKRPMLFMKAFAKIDKEEKDKFEVICTGIDEQYRIYGNEIETYCKENEIRLKLIRFDYMYEAYSIADLVILPSQSESFGYSALEALTCGIPTILSAIPTYIEISEGSKNVYIFDNTEESLLNELKKVIKSELTRMNQSAEWQNKYDLQKFGERYLKILNAESEKVKMSDIQIYKPYENWKEFNIIEENGKKFLELYNYKLQIDETNYIPKAGLLFEEILKEKADGKNVLDLGCGQMGILGLIALHYGAKKLLSVDVDERCIKWFSTIIQENNIKNIRVLKSDMFANIDKKEKFNLILSNPPHMPMKSGKLCDSGGSDGKKYIIEIIKKSFNYLEDNGELNMMMFDFEGTNKSYNNDKSIFELAKEIGYSEIKTIFTFEKDITPGSVTYDCLDYIKKVYPKYNFGMIKPKCNIIINSFRK